ncbi:MAG: hypothetical protein ACREHD_24630 [Pirellulales bacterium]
MGKNEPQTPLIPPASGDIALLEVELPSSDIEAMPADKILGPASVEDAAFEDVLQLISGENTTTSRSAPARAPAPAAPQADEPAGAIPKIVVSAPPPIPPLAAFSPPPPSAPPVAAHRVASRHGRHDDTVLLITRKAIYAQAALVGGLLMLAFVAGLIIGRSSRSTAKAAADGKGASAEPVPLEGYVLYSLSPGQSVPDNGATVIALPGGKTPTRKISARGLRPGNGDDLSALPAADHLRSLGGTVARTDNTGQFQLVVPRPGNYSLLIVSHRATRPDGQPVARADLDELGRVFTSPNELIGQNRYAILSQRLAGAPRPITHEFGPIDKD